MNVFTTQRLNTSIIAVLIVLNVMSLGTIWFLQSRQTSVAPPKGPGPIKNFLAQELGLTPEQAEQFETLRQEHFQESKTLNDEMQPLKEAIMQEVFAASPDSAKVKTLAEEIGAQQAALEELRFQHFLALKAVCQPEQLGKFQALIHELFPPQNPPNEGRPPQPAPAPKQGQAPNAGPPREAVEICRGKAQGSSCQFTAPHGEVTGVCRSIGPQFACVPERDGAKSSQESP